MAAFEEQSRSKIYAEFYKVLRTTEMSPRIISKPQGALQFFEPSSITLSANDTLINMLVSTKWRRSNHCSSSTMLHTVTTASIPLIQANPTQSNSAQIVDCSSAMHYTWCRAPASTLQVVVQWLNHLHTPEGMPSSQEWDSTGGHPRLMNISWVET